MLYISRWKALAILLTVLSVSAMAIPNLLPDQIYYRLPGWAQRKIDLGLYQRGGIQLVLAADADQVRRDMVSELRTEVRRMLRESHIPGADLQARGDGVDVRVRAPANFNRTLAKLRELSWPDGQHVRDNHVPPERYMFVADKSVTADRRAPIPPAEVMVEADRTVIRLTITEAAFNARIDQRLRRSMQEFGWRASELRIPGTIQAGGPGRVEVQLAGISNLSAFQMYNQ